MNILAMILAGGRVDELSVLTLNRPKSTMPYGGVYRIIDFALSNLMHSGIDLVGILSQYRSSSLIHHVGTGASWDFIGRKRGAFILPPSKGTISSDWYRGTADAIYQNLDFIDTYHPDRVLILSGDHIYKMNYGDLIRFHEANRADLSISFVQRPESEASRFGLARFDAAADERGGLLIGYDEKPKKPTSNWASMTVYLFNMSVLREALNLCEDKSMAHFGRDIIPRLIGNYRVFGYKFQGVWGYTQTIDEYWSANMALLKPEPEIDLKQWEVRTNLANENIRDRTPSHFDSQAKIENSLIYNGCKVSGQVINSVIFPGVVIGSGALVKDSIVFYDTIIENGAILDKVIADVRVQVGSDVKIGIGDADRPNTRYPDLLKSGITIIGRDTIIPADIQISKNCIVVPGLKATKFRKNLYHTGEYIQ